MESIQIQDWLKTKVPLRYNESGKFRILCISDIHGGVGYDKDFTVDGLKKILTQAKPEMVLILGDIAGPGVIHIETAEQLKEFLTGLVEPIESAGIPWAHVFGNHDNNFGVSNREAQTVYETFPHCVSKCGPQYLDGAANYVLPVYDSCGKDILFNIFGLDSHRGIDEFCNRYHPNAPYDHFGMLPHNGGFMGGERGVDFEQVVWYYQMSCEMEQHCGRVIPAMMVMHVPLRELDLVSMNYSFCNAQGEHKEPVGSSNLNSGLFRAALERGDIRAMCFGHDHENNFGGYYCGIHLAGDGYLSRHACHNPDMFGGRVYDVDTDGNITTYTILVKDCQ